MFPVYGSYKLHHRGKRVLMRRLVGGGVLLVFVSLLVLSLGWPQGLAKPTAAQITLRPQKKLFGVGERPMLRLSLKSAPHVGLLSPKVFAAETPQVKVNYDGGPTDLPTQTTPVSDGYTVAVGDAASEPKPGTYTVTVTGQTNDGQDFSAKSSFAWGVMAVNTDKSDYAPGEVAHLQMGVVGNTGHTICDAPLQLVVTDPSGQATTVPYTNSTQCQGDSYSDEPDYSADYQTKGAGTYHIDLSIKNTTYSLSDSFQVSENPLFDVRRVGNTRLLPTHPYPMQLLITPGQAFSGQVREELPDKDFQVLSISDGGVATKAADHVTITWNVSWPAGTAQRLAYSFQPPQRSPAFFQLALLQFIDQSGVTQFKESRGWQYVNDAIMGFVKSTVFNIASATSTTQAITSTNGNTLVLVFSENASGTAPGLATVTDSTGSNTWVVPSGNPSQNPPANSVGSGVSSEMYIAYKIASGALTSITLTLNGAANAFSFTVMEFTNIDATIPVDQSASSGNAANPTGPNFTQSTPAVNVSACKVPSTDILMRGGDFFCTSPDELIVGGITAGSASTSTECNLDPSSTCLHDQTEMNLVSTTVHGHATYAITDRAQPSYQIIWDLSVSKACGIGIIVFRETPSTGSNKQYLFWVS
ncbi:MAG TPA: hypothetical protein VLF91_06195 [Candidatus Saccharimonadales bacterium]|nr:hypothetical protein [Candidatus Saccharimonadales bacterium]